MADQDHWPLAERPGWPLDAESTGALVELALSEDVADGDATAQCTIPENARLKATMVAREPLVLAGLPFAAAVFWALDPEAQLDSSAHDGDRLDTGAHILSIEGNARAVLTAERTALNMVQYLSGIATLTNRYVKALKNPSVRLLDTRKTLPGHRLIAKYATAMGGAKNHRMGLYDAIMIKDNHIVAAGGITAAVNRARAASSLNVQVECDTLEQVKEALEAGADSLLLDNMSLDQLRAAVDLKSSMILQTGCAVTLEASGGVTLDTIGDISETGVDSISVGRLTQSAPAIDIGLDYL